MKDHKTIIDVGGESNLLLSMLRTLSTQDKGSMPSAFVHNGRISGNSAPNLNVTTQRLVELISAFADRDAVHNSTDLEQTTPSAGVAIAHTYTPAVPPGTPGYVLCPIIGVQFELHASQQISASPVDLRVTGTDWQGNAFVQQCVVRPDLQAKGNWSTKVIMLPGVALNSGYVYQPMRYNPLIIAGVYAATNAVLDIGIAGGNLAPAGVACSTKLLVAGTSEIDSVLEYVSRKRRVRDILMDVIAQHG